MMAQRGRSSWLYSASNTEFIGCWSHRLSVDNRPMSVDITLMSVAPHPLSPADRPLDVVSMHFHQEVRLAKRFPRAESDTAFEWTVTQNATVDW